MLSFIINASIVNLEAVQFTYYRQQLFQQVLHLFSSEIKKGKEKFLEVKEKVLKIKSELLLSFQKANGIILRR